MDHHLSIFHFLFFFTFFSSSFSPLALLLIFAIFYWQMQCTRKGCVKLSEIPERKSDAPKPLQIGCVFLSFLLFIRLFDSNNELAFSSSLLEDYPRAYDDLTIRRYSDKQCGLASETQISSSTKICLSIQAFTCRKRKITRLSIKELKVNKN